MEIYRQAIAFEKVPVRLRAQAVAEGELSPPGSLPGIASVLTVGGQATANATAQEGGFVSDGAVTLSVTYVCADGKVHGFDSVAVFRHTADYAKATAGMHADASATLGDISWRVSNGRLMVKAAVDIDILARENARAEAIAQVGATECRTNRFTANQVDSMHDEIALREEARLPRIAQNLMNLSGFARASVSISGNTAHIDGTLRVCATFCASDGMLTQAPLNFDFSHTMSVPSNTTGALVCARVLTLSGMLVDDDIIALDAEIGLTLYCITAEQYDMLTDAYDTARTITCESMSASTANVAASASRTQVRLTVPIPEGMPAAERTLTLSARPQVESASSTKGMLNIEGTMQVSAVYACHEGLLHGLSTKLPFAATLDAPGLPTSDMLHVNVDTELIHAGANNMELPVNLSLDASALSFDVSSAVFVTNVIESERAQTPTGAMIYFPAQDEDLWSVGKKFGIPLAEITRLNPNLGEKPEPVLLNIG